MGEFEGSGSWPVLEFQGRSVVIVLFIELLTKEEPVASFLAQPGE